MNIIDYHTVPRRDENEKAFLKRVNGEANLIGKQLVSIVYHFNQLSATLTFREMGWHQKVEP